MPSLGRAGLGWASQSKTGQGNNDLCNEAAVMKDNEMKTLQDSPFADCEVKPYLECGYVVKDGRALNTIRPNFNIVRDSHTWGAALADAMLMLSEMVSNVSGESKEAVLTQMLEAFDARIKTPEAVGTVQHLVDRTH